ncbi:MAG: putative permease [Acidobacteria bacterium OLB17]|nr:MAG: putative permease [Acidobacteria bacterium OLB17]MCZ2389582.1 LptF/LptG family permease [Acidobacteriota bacterium]
MTRVSSLISRYLLGAVVPYFLFSWVLLTVILFLQQASRYSELFFNINIPSSLIWQLMIGLIPNVIAFTCPMAVLVGTIIGLSKMQGDSELTAIRAAGVGNVQIAVPIVILGIALSLFALVVNIKGVPFAAALVREVAMRSAISKFESPIEPGIFYTEIDGYTILARDTDPTNGDLKRVFISQKDSANGVYRLITSDIGRIQIAGESTELVLENAAVVTIPEAENGGKYAFERIHDIRVALKTKRAELLKRLASSVRLPDELGLEDLTDAAAAAEGKTRVEAQIVLFRRFVMSLTPLIFSLLGMMMVLRFRRGGRGFGIVLALGALVGYYLVAFSGEQLARAGALPVAVASLLPVAASLAAMFWLVYGPRFRFAESASNFISSRIERFKGRSAGLSFKNRIVDVTSGLRDFDIAASVAWYFLLATAFLLIVFLIFTAFDTWRFASQVENGGWMLVKYLTFLVPFAYLQIAPSAAMIAILAAYAIKSRNNELVTWAAAGQSMFRLLMPCLALALVLGVADFAVQETIAPRANQVQDSVRAELRSGGKPAPPKRLWTSEGKYLFSYILGPDGPYSRKGEGRHYSASDNEMDRLRGSGSVGFSARDIFVLEFSDDNEKLQTVYRARAGEFNDSLVRLFDVVSISRSESGLDEEIKREVELKAEFDPFRNVGGKPNHLSVRELAESAAAAGARSERDTYAVGVQKRIASLFVPLVIVLFSAPWGISLRRAPMVSSLSVAVGLWLVFIGLTNIFEQYGASGFLPPIVAVWTPVFGFATLGIYLISRIRT